MAAPNVIVMVAQASAGLIETWFVGKLGTDALAGMSLVFPVVMLMQMMSAGAMGGGIASAVARALGRRQRDDAHALVFHALALAGLFGVIFTLAALLGGPMLYASMGGHDASLQAALTYSNWVFAGALWVWIFNSLASVVRGTGNMALPAQVITVGTVVLVPLSPLLIFGWGPVPALGIAGGALALLLYYVGGSVALGAYLLSKSSLLKPKWSDARFQKAMFADILRVGLAGTVSTVATNVAIGLTTGLVGQYGPAAIAGYGTASRLEYLLVPLVFGFGGPLVAMVGTAVGAGKRQRALQATWMGAAMAVAMCESIGLLAACFPAAWLTLFDSDPAMVAAGSQYLRIVGPAYGLFGLGLILYFASQGAGRLLWPVVGNLVRLLVAALGGWLALHWGFGLVGLFAAQALAVACYGAINATAVAKGAWFNN
jgi:putative MATE family efflux protein